MSAADSPRDDDLPPGFLRVGGDQAPWYDRVYLWVRRIPSGRVSTYGDVATFLGHPRRARQVGWALAALPPDTDVPWQRVINRLGEISLRGEIERPLEQRRRLEEEGVVFDAADRCDLPRLRWHPDGA